MVEKLPSKQPKKSKKKNTTKLHFFPQYFSHFPVYWKLHLLQKGIVSLKVMSCKNGALYSIRSDRRYSLFRIVRSSMFRNQNVLFLDFECFYRRNEAWLLIDNLNLKGALIKVQYYRTYPKIICSYVILFIWYLCDKGDDFVRAQVNCVLFVLL